MIENKYNLLKNWDIHRALDGDVVVVGTIYNDAKGRFEDGTIIRTSTVRNVDFVTGILETRNTLYNLDLRRPL